ncbi:MAG TPA: hypothetical protein VM755_02070 [Stellaceae bacterium]|nr:hypothetical protein [Stellaceae bacterium]
MRLGHRHIRPFRDTVSRRLGLWAALFAVLCQIVVPIGHDPIALLVGQRCPGLDLPVAAGVPHGFAGSAHAAPSGQPLAHGHGQSCPIFQSFTYLAPLGSSGPPPLPVPSFGRLHHFLADWTGLIPADGSFSRPFPRAPPARA